MSYFDWDAFFGLGEFRGVWNNFKKAVKPYVPGVVVLMGCAGMVALAKYCPVAVPVATIVAIVLGLLYVINKSR